jgi:Circularly permutated YpsA SLOG family
LGVAEAGTNVYLATLQDHEQDLAASAGVFRAQAEQWAEPSRGERTTEAVFDLAIGGAFALLGGIAAPWRDRRRRCGRVEQDHEADRRDEEEGRRKRARADRQSRCGGQGVAWRGSALTDTGIHAAIPEQRLINVEARANGPGNKWGVKTKDLYPAKEPKPPVAGGSSMEIALPTDKEPRKKGRLEGLEYLSRTWRRKSATRPDATWSLRKRRPQLTVLHIYDTRKEDSLRLEIQALIEFLSSNKIEILNVAGPRESKEPGVYDWTLTMLRFLNRAWDPQKQPGE